MGSGRVLNYLLKVRSEEGVVHLTLIDPDPLNQPPEVAGQMAKYVCDAGTDAIMVGGSTAFGILDETIKKIKEATNLPVILFPGNVSGISKLADAIFFMSVLNSRNPYFITKAQALGSFAVKLYGLEPIGMAYLVVEPGGTVGYMSEANLLPRSKPQIAAAYALAAQYMGFKLVYLEAGSGASSHVPNEMISMVSKTIDIPLIVGGGIRTEDDAVDVVEAGADMIVQGTMIEETALKDKGESLRKVINAAKKAGAKRVR
ncbi:MAG: geranylgeranylglyceryl/heptaprenylglyceryl phosphate synthase [Candidatus Freyarchaeota archaeon]|nr:geranylgeranylglyceryl/heptaprenylglyceryl phosphate synthase [Candidatus Jordarchaeia archaeon]